MNPLQNLCTAWPGVLQSTGAATVAWFLAQWLLGHQRPSFAAIAAIVCLSPGLASRGRQAVGMVAGVAVGVVVGEAAKHLGGDLVWPMALSAALAMFAAVLFSVQPVLIIQAGASAILVVATSAGTGYVRLEDAAIGAALGLLGSQVILTPDPGGLIEQAFAQVATPLSDGLAQAARAVDERNDATMQPALENLRHATHASVDLTGKWEEAGRMVR